MNCPDHTVWADLLGGLLVPVTFVACMWALHKFGGRK